MNTIVKYSVVVALAIVAAAWSQFGEAQQVHSAVAKARGEFGQVPQPNGWGQGYVAPSVAVQQPFGVAWTPYSGAVRTYSYGPNYVPNRAVAGQRVAPSVPVQPQHPGFHASGAKVLGEFGK